MSSDPYGVLGLPPSASQAEIKRAYRALVKVHHPDSAGESSLPRFLTIQGAYEQLLDPRLRAAAAARSRASGRRSEPWNADPSRAREARANAGMGGAEGTGATQGRGGASGPRARGTSSGQASPGAAPRGGDPKPGGTRRRSTRKATPGSTSYDEARDPADTAWDGAAWYGQTSGEYWRVNPREYADPRKHGPEYQARAAGQRPRATARGEGPPAASPHREAPPAPGPRGEDAATARPAHRTPPPRRAPAGAPNAGPADSESRHGDVAQAADAPPLDVASVLPFGIDGKLLERLGRRRWVVALLAWPPIGVATAALIGGATGCAAFAATCTTAGQFYPWIAQAVILAALLVAPGVARLFASGTAAVVIMAFPVAATLSASGASYDRVYGPASLIGILTVVWLVGVTFAVVRYGSLRRLQSPSHE